MWTSRIIELRKYPALGLALLFWLLLPLGLEQSARAEDGTGTVILTLNASVVNGSPVDAYRAYYIRARRIGGDGGAQFSWHEGWLVSSPNDLASSGGKGEVIVKDLAPGDWEIYWFRLETHGYPIRVRWTPRQEFSIPFKIRPGRATYIGSYQPVGHMYKNMLGIMSVGGGSFVVSDQSARDIPIAKTIRPDLGPVDVDVFDVDMLHNPLLSRGAGAPTPDEALFAQ